MKIKGNDCDKKGSKDEQGMKWRREGKKKPRKEGNIRGEGGVAATRDRKTKKKKKKEGMKGRE